MIHNFWRSDHTTTTKKQTHETKPQSNNNFGLKNITKKEIIKFIVKANLHQQKN